ncbi:hypothetical protein DERF_000607 [Dermatophagoides farinae]|uniref:GDT1 family protein n=1 Tax=Dermatophagoides farinae TaxID=6954 RepID=A0A922IAJ0_DERFA|nr:transmembrane protein 165-like [Dermatophagoides farinae]KAH7640908.1 transmembrane protein 165-like protein [Dermatophagoides farinae]KAH9526530.1 hypothetical protein DERF_000607 [Dermatophagoides farinae]
MVATLISDLLAGNSNSTTTGDDVTFWSRLNEVKFIHGYIASFSVIIVSELGDKTFFIAAIMAMRHSRLKVFAAAMLAILVMNTLAVLMGMATTVIPPVVIKYASSGLFLIFAIKMFYEGCNMTDEDSKEEMEEVQKAINKKELTASIDYESIPVHQDPETGIIKTPRKLSMTTKMRRKLMQYVSLVFIETFTMTFLAEWGDRSQISTIILAASDDIYGVFFGALSGHFICTGIAVLGGRIISQMISVKTVTILGAFIFLLFAILGIFLN